MILGLISVYISSDRANSDEYSHLNMIGNSVGLEKFGF